MLNDARTYQILFLGLFLLIGIGTRDWTLHPTMIGVTIATCLSVQVGMWLIVGHWSLVTGQEAEASDRNSPILDRNSPILDRNSPILDQYSPILDQYSPILDRQLAILDRDSPNLDGGSPIFDRNPQILDRDLPIPDQNLVIKDQKSIGKTLELLTQNSQLKTLFHSLPSALVTSLGLSLLLRADHYTTVMLASALAIASKFLLRVRGKHIFNPGNFGIIAALTLMPDAWVSPGQWGEEGWYVLLFLGTGGIVVGKVGRWDTTAAFLGVYAALEAIRNLWLGWTWDVWAHRLMSGSLLVFALFMVTDPRTIPNARVGRLLWAGAIAVLTFILRNVFFIPTAVFWALFALAPLSIVFDLVFPAARFDWKQSVAEEVKAGEDAETRGRGDAESFELRVLS